MRASEFNARLNYIAKAGISYDQVRESAATMQRALRGDGDAVDASNYARAPIDTQPVEWSDPDIIWICLSGSPYLFVPPVLPQIDR